VDRRSLDDEEVRSLDLEEDTVSSPVGGIAVAGRSYLGCSLVEEDSRRHRRSLAEGTVTADCSQSWNRRVRTL